MSGSLGRRFIGRLSAISGRLVIIVVIIAATGVLVGALFLPAALATNDVIAAVRDDVLDVPPLGEADTPPQNSYIYAADGAELAELTFEENRVPVTLDEVGPVAIDAVLATEDAEFYTHEGVNHTAIVRAALTNFASGNIESGASTITQQYVKLAFLSPEQTIARKIEEAIYAIQLEDELSKDEILERYLNRAYFGNGVYGIGTAAERYFSTAVADLSLGDTAMLAGLLRAPEANNPIRNLENAQDRRDIVLRQMASTGFVSLAQAQAAIDQPLVIDVSEPPPPRNPFWSRWVSQLLINENAASDLGTQLEALELMGETREERSRTVFQSGLRIHTTIDPELQLLAENAIMEHLSYEDEPADEIAQEPMGAIVSVEPGTGAIRTMALGPYGFGDCRADGSWVGELETGELLCDRTQVNPAVPGGGGSGRQPGSGFKPFLDAAALEDGYSAGLVLDARGPQDIDGCATSDDGPYTVNNSGGDGILDMYEAVKQSSNVYHALLIAEVGPQRVADMALRLTGYPVDTDDQGCALALGATDTSPLAMATGYATLANRGEYCAPFPISRIDDANGRTIWEHRPDCEQVIDTEIADRVVDLLEGPVTPGGTAPGANLGEWETRGKTGSTNDNRDAWFFGFVKQLATAAWVGYPTFEQVYATQEQANAACGAEDAPRCLAPFVPMRNVTIGGESYRQVFGGTIPAPMWTTYMEQAVQRYEPEAFERPGPIPRAQVPNLLEASSLEEAEELALEAGFRLDVDTVADWRSEGTFLRQTPSPGGQLALGGRIELDVSDGSGRVPAIPDVRGRTLDAAAGILFAEGYRVFQTEVETNDPDLVGRVVTMSPGPGSRLNPNASGGVTLGIGVAPPEPEPEPEPEPDPPEDEEPTPPDEGGGGNGDGGNGSGDGGGGNGSGDGGGGNGSGDGGGGNGSDPDDD